MKLITWNIQTGRGVDGRIDLKRIVQHARLFSDFDVLCLQEVCAGYPKLSGSEHGDQFAELARLLPEYTAIEGAATNVPGTTGRRRFGNMILSRYPVLQVFPHLLPWPPDTVNSGMQRVALEASLDTPLGLIRVTTTHLEYYSARQRLAQVERLRQLHQEAVKQARNPPIAGNGGATPEDPFFPFPRGEAAILCGDFNFSPESAERHFLLSQIDDATPRFHDSWNLLHPNQAHPDTVGIYDKVQWPGPPLTLDFIFVSEDLADKLKNMRVSFSTDASDHQPTMIELG